MFLFMCMFLVTPAHPLNIVFVNPDSVGSGQATISASVSKKEKGRFWGSSQSSSQSCPNVLRQRTALLNADELSNLQNAESINLQLFDDVRLIASQTKVQKGRNGCLMWTGRVSGVEGGQIVLVVLNRKVFSSIYLPASVIQIRPEGEEIFLKGAQHTGAGAGGRDSLCGVSPSYLIRELKSGLQVDGREWSTEGTVRTVSAKSFLSPFAKGGESAGAPLSFEERKIIELVNLEREAEGVSVLQFNDRLAEAARSHARDMAMHNYSSHDRRDGRKFWQSVFDNGYPVSKCGENIAVGQATPEEAFECLISSPGHRANIIDPDFTQIGVGHAISPTSAFHYFWTQEFGAGDKRERTLRQGAAHSAMGLFASLADGE